MQARLKAIHQAVSSADENTLKQIEAILGVNQTIKN